MNGKRKKGWFEHIMPDDAHPKEGAQQKNKTNWMKTKCNETKSFWWKATHLFRLGIERKGK